MRRMILSALVCLLLVGTAFGAGPGKKVILICDKIGTNPFLTQMQDGLAAMKAKYGLTTAISEMADASAWEDSIRAAVMEKYDLIIVAGSQGADPINAVATEFPKAATYVLVDAIRNNPNLKSIAFREAEGAYLIGMIAGLVNPTNKFGAVHASQSQSSYKWRWGYMEGVKAVRGANVTFMFNYTNSYTDAAKAKEFALQQAAAGCGFINAASAVADFGTFEAAKEKKFYTSGQDQDRTNPNNPWILTTQIKDTSMVITRLIEQYMTGKLTMENELYGIREGVIGALYITKDGPNPINPILTKYMIARVKKAADDIASGKLKLEVPMEVK